MIFVKSDAPGTSEEESAEVLDFRVTDKAMRPASPLRECFYCHKPVGEQHAHDCVLLCRRVRVRLKAPYYNVTHEYVIKTVAAWDDYEIEFYLNDSSWCVDNAIRGLPPEVVTALGRSVDEDDEHEPRQCLCNYVTFAYLGETDGKMWLEE